MNWKNRLKNYNFWISLFSAVLLILQALKIEFDIAYINEIFTAVLGLLVVVGIISDPTKTLIKSTEANSSKLSDSNSSLGVVAQKNEEKTDEKSLPIVEENEVDKLLNKNDIENVVLKLTQDLNEKIEKINNFAFIQQSKEELKDFCEVGQIEENLEEINESKDIVESKVEEVYVDAQNCGENLCDSELNNSDLIFNNELEKEEVCEDSQNLVTNQNTSYLNIY